MKYHIDQREIEIHTIVSDLNGTLADFGHIPEKTQLFLHKFLQQHHFRFILLTSDKRGNAKDLAETLGVEYHIAKTSTEKQQFAEALSEPFFAIGNARNDIPLFEKAVLSFVILGKEGLHTATLTKADILVQSFEDALFLIADNQAVESTLNQ